MKFLNTSFYTLLCLFFLSGDSLMLFGVDHPSNPPVVSPELNQPELNQPELNQFEKSLDNTYKNYIARSNNFSNPEFFRKLKFRDKINNKIIEFHTLPDLDKTIFYILEGEKISLEAKNIEGAWRNIMVNVLKTPGKGIDIDSLESYIIKLRELRKNHAKEYENFVEKALNANSSKIPEEEINFLLKNIKKWNDKEKLIDRNG